MNQELTTQKSFLPMPTNLDEAWRLAKILAVSDMVPKDFKGKPENCMIAMQWGSDIGIPGIQALQNIAVINGRPSIWGDAAKALVIGRADCEDINEYFEGEGDRVTAVCVVKRKGKSPTISKFSLTDAKAAGLLGKQGPWTQYRNRMLQMRARGFALRDAFPDALRGLSIAEEAQDMPAEKEINPIVNKDETLTIEDQLLAIKTMAIEDFKTIDPAKLSEDEKKTIRKAMAERKKEIESLNKDKATKNIDTEKVAEDWVKNIKECGDKASLDALLLEMPESVQIELGDLLDEQFDLLR